VVAALWWPFRAAYVAALAAVAEAFLRIAGRRPVVLGLTPGGDLIRLTTTLDAGSLPAAAWDAGDLHLYVIAALAMALAPPLRDRRRQLRLLGLAFGLAWAATQAITVVQVKSVAGAHAAAHLGIAVHGAAEEALLQWASRALIMVGMLLLPALVFLLAYLAWMDETSGPTTGAPAGGARDRGARRAGRMPHMVPRTISGRRVA
jgi:hypothetical protein